MADGGRPRGVVVVSAGAAAAAAAARATATDGRGATRGSAAFVDVLDSTAAPTRGDDDDDDDDLDSTAAARYDAFANEVVSFLDGAAASHRAMSRDELRRVLERHLDHRDDDIDDDGRGRAKTTIDETMALLGRDVFLAIGDAAAAGGGGGGGVGRRHPFVLHLCPVPDLDAMLASHRVHLRRIIRDDDDRDDDDDGGGGGGASTTTATATSRAVAAHAWLNARLTEAFASPDRRRGGGGDDDGGNEVGRHPGRPSPPSSPTSIVHLHRDVWLRSRSIVESRLRGKCGMHRRRYYARKTAVRKISKSEYVPFLTEHHLWGATGAKFAYGLFAKDGGAGPVDLVAVASFSSGRTISRADRPFRSFELLRFCTAKDSTVVGGLTKLLSAFVRDVTAGRGEGDGSAGVDVVTSIDRDFGRGDAWPNFVSVEVMDPVPMFVGDVDGARRHAVGAGLTPLEQPRRRRRRTTGDEKDDDDDDDDDNDDDNDDDDRSKMISSPWVLRAGLPNSLLCELDEGWGDDRDDREDDPWRTAARHGFHPVFDAGVERLISVVADGGGGDEDEDGDDGRTKIGPCPVELWDASTPRYAKEHYSSNAGVRAMLQCIRSSRELGDY